MEDGLNFDERVKRGEERSGANIWDILTKKDPWESPCGREDYLVCENTPARKGG